VPQGQQLFLNDWEIHSQLSSLPVSSIASREIAYKAQSN